MSDPSAMQLPPGWVLASLPDICQINPPLDRCVLNDAVLVNFVPMKAVDEEGGGVSRPESCAFAEVKKGYTPFLSGDVIMAKITPCMENGKTTVVPPLPGDVCFGSTEFHVFRPESEVGARWLAKYLVQQEFRQTAKRQMGGGVGQMRVPTTFLESVKLPLAPSSEQQRILDGVDELLSDLDAGVTALERVQKKLMHYRAAVLKAAVEGELTADWRAQHPDAEPASELLPRILTERRRRWEEDQLRKFQEVAKEPPTNWKAKYVEPVKPATTSLSNLPESWSWVSAEQACECVVDCHNKTAPYTPSGIPLIRTTNIRNGRIELQGARYVSQKTYEFWSRRCPPKPGDVLFTREAPMGEAGMVPDDVTLCMGQRMMLLRASPAIANRYLLISLRSPFLAAYIGKTSVGGGVQHLRVRDVESLPIPLPPLAEQEAIVEAVEAQLSVIDHLEADIAAKLKSAQGLRQSILRHAFTGQLVPQDPNDEPASELLKRISTERTERARMATSARLATKAARRQAKPPTKKAASKRARKSI